MFLWVLDGSSDPIPSGGHRYWRIAGVTVVGSHFETPELQLLVGGTVVSAGITPTATPGWSGHGTLDILSDGILDPNRVYWTQAIAQAPTFYIRWDLGTPRPVDGVRQAGWDTADRCMSSFTLQYADDPGGPWTNYGYEGGITYPGDSTLSEVYDMIPYANESGSFRHWRLYVTANDGDASYVSFSELELLHTLTDFTTSPINLTATQSGTGAVGPASAGASDDVEDECGSNWSGGPYWWQIDLGTPRVIDSMSLRSQRSAAGRTPSTFIVQGSASSGGPWTDVITVTGSTGWGVKEKRLFLV